MTFKDEMKAAGKKPGDAAPAPQSAGQADSNDIAKLLRVLNEDLRADPADDVAVLEDEVDAKAERHLPVGKIAAALVAAAGIGVAVVLFDQSADVPPPAPPPLIAAAPSTAAPGGSSPALTRAPAGQPEPLIARAPISTAPATTAPATTAPAPAAAPLVAPPPPAAALPQIPPPALKVPEPPPAPPATAPVEPTATMAPAATPAAAPEPAKAAAPLPAPVEEPTKPVPAAKPAETAELQAMLAPKAPTRAPIRPDAKPPAAAPAPVAPPQAAKPTVLTPPAVPSVPDGHFAVQVGTFQIAENADALLRRLRDGGYTAQVVDWTDAEQRSWHAVRVGGYADRATAKRAADSLKARMGLPALVVGTR
ncbi:SPOR domain-containing protein [Azospirillum canadense]|uniref:SPOR domain-containing protein n=1 Tax=Azospirillum canadense TaxID=403962 RepID=UPI0022261FCB|nr:SPOR domain-containing protein [Azospirillum canadense]MCW2235993.1 cell division septation protein DedD [Azospirillum canadense]